MIDIFFFVKLTFFKKKLPEEYNQKVKVSTSFKPDQAPPGYKLFAKMTSEGTVYILKVVKISK